jgi:hypothetical protein
VPILCVGSTSRADEAEVVRTFESAAAKKLRLVKSQSSGRADLLKKYCFVLEKRGVDPKEQSRLKAKFETEGAYVWEDDVKIHFMFENPDKLRRAFNDDAVRDNSKVQFCQSPMCGSCYPESRRTRVRLFVNGADGRVKAQLRVLHSKDGHKVIAEVVEVLKAGFEHTAVKNCVVEDENAQKRFVGESGNCRFQYMFSCDLLVADMAIVQRELGWGGAKLFCDPINSQKNRLCLSCGERGHDGRGCELSRGLLVRYVFAHPLTKASLGEITACDGVKGNCLQVFIGNRRYYSDAPNRVLHVLWKRDLASSGSDALIEHYGDGMLEECPPVVVDPKALVHTCDSCCGAIVHQGGAQMCPLLSPTFRRTGSVRKAKSAGNNIWAHRLLVAGAKVVHTIHPQAQNSGENKKIVEEKQSDAVEDLSPSQTSSAVNAKESSPATSVVGESTGSLLSSSSTSMSSSQTTTAVHSKEAESRSHGSLYSNSSSDSTSSIVSSSLSCSTLSSVSSSAVSSPSLSLLSSLSVSPDTVSVPPSVLSRSAVSSVPPQAPERAIASSKLKPVSGYGKALKARPKGQQVDGKSSGKSRELNNLLQ